LRQFLDIVHTPQVRLLAPNAQGRIEKYLFGADFDALTTEEIGTFLQAYYAGSLKPFLRSELEQAD
jgi:hypothetical protein